MKEQFQNQNLRNDSASGGEEKKAILNPPLKSAVINTISSNIITGGNSPRFGEQDKVKGSLHPQINHLVNSAIASSEENITNDPARDQGSMHQINRSDSALMSGDPSRF